VRISEVVNQGKNVAHLDASLYVDGVLVARANGDFAIFKRKSEPASA
jgi:acyl-coenzyme A thioesterase PaaI-like protein